MAYSDVEVLRNFRNSGYKFHTTPYGLLTLGGALTSLAALEMCAPPGLRSCYDPQRLFPHLQSDLQSGVHASVHL